MNLVIFGANGPVGKVLTERALEAGHGVTAVTHHPDAFLVRHARLKVLAGDVLHPAEVARAIRSQDAVLSLVGVPYTRKPVTVYSKGITNILAAMKDAGVRRLIGVTSGGTNPGFHWDEGLFFGLVLKPFFGKTLYADMLRMEELVFASDCDWTIVRPARLVDSAKVTDYATAQAFMVPGMRETSGLDLADFMLKEVEQRRFVRKAVALGSPRT